MLRMKNKEILEQNLASIGLVLGVYRKTIDEVSRGDLSRVIAQMTNDRAEIPVRLKGGTWIVQTYRVKNVVNLRIHAKSNT